MRTATIAVVVFAARALGQEPHGLELAGPAPGNLLSNPSMEFGVPERDLVVDWVPAPEFPGPTYTWAREVAHDGLYSLSIHNVIGPQGANGGWQSSGFSTIPGVIYQFEAFVNPGTHPGFTYLVLAWFDRRHNWIGNTRNGSLVAPVDDWVRVGVADTSPPGAAYARPYFRSDANAAAVHCDRASLRVVRGDTTAVPIANGSFEVPEPSTWTANGPSAIWVSDTQVAREGTGCIGFLPQGGRSAWVSPLFGTGTLGEAAVTVEFFADRSGARTGNLQTWLRSINAEGRAKDGAPLEIVLGGAGYSLVSLSVAPPEDAAYCQLVIQANGLDGPVYMDDANLRVAAPALPSRLATAAAIARAYTATFPSPDQVEARFIRTFPGVEERAELAADVAEAIAEGVTPADETLQLFLAQCRYHAGDLDGCMELALSLKERLSINDLRFDLTLHYIHHASQAIAERERAHAIAALDHRRAAVQGVQVKSEVAKSYENAGAPDRAAHLYDELSSAENADIARWAAFRAGICHSLAQRHNEAIERLRRFLEAHDWTRWAPEARIQLGESLYALGHYRECIELLLPALRDAQWASPAAAEGLLRRCYRKQADDPSAVAEYCELFRLPGMPRLAYLGEDRTTQGNWAGSYGRSAFVLCAMASPRDIVGGDMLPVRVAREDNTERQATTVAWTDSKRELVYSCYTGDPANPARLFLHVDQTDDPRALTNPMWGRRTFALWDDRGETHPFDDRGPDLYMRVEIPPGAWVLSLYFLDWDFDPEAPFPATHEVVVTDLFDGHHIRFQVDTFGDGVYHSTGILGPMEAEIRVRKGRSLCAAVSGLFLDPMTVPVALDPAPADDVSSLRAQLDLCASDPIRFAETWEPAEASTKWAPRDALAAWALVEALPGRSEEASRAARTWLRAIVDQQGQGEAVSAARELLLNLFDCGDIGAAEALLEPLLESDDSPDLPLAAAQRLRVKDLRYAKLLLDRYADSVAERRETEALQREALRWFALAEQDRQDTRNLRRTTFILSLLLLRRLEASFGAEALGEEGARALAYSRCEQNWFDWGWTEAAREVERFLNRFPASRHVPEAVQRLANCYYIVSQGDARDTPSPGLLRTADAISAAHQRFPESSAVAAAMVKLGLAHENRREYENALKWFEQAASFPEDIRSVHGINDLVVRIREQLTSEGGDNDG